MIKKIIMTVAVICFLGVNIAYADEDMQLNAKSAVLIDGDNGRILYGKNENEKMPMASTTKIMTCILAIENSNPDDVAEVSDYAASMPEVKLNMKSGEKYYMGDLLYSLMLESHNDTAVAVAENIGGSVENFAAMMNKKARSIGAYNTHFVTPNGLDDDEHFSTAYDLTLIAAYALKNDKFMEIINTSAHTFSDVTGNRSFTVNNKDAFLSMFDGAVGVKTGFTGKAGYCFVGAVYRGERKFISAVLASGWPPHRTYKWQDTKLLMNYGIDNYDFKEIYNGDSYKGKIKVREGVEKSVELYSEGYEKILVADGEKIEVKEVLYKYIDAPVEKNQIVGKLIIKIDSKVYREYCIKSCKQVKKRDFKWEFERIFSEFLLDFFGEKLYN